ncbi:hypothetical protein V8B97DRAFT_1872938 [Scleroderma yunnanense]
MQGPQTPPSTRPSITPDTVPRARNTSQPSYRTGDLNLGKTAVIKDLNHIAVVPLDYFNTAVLPPLYPQIDLADIESSLYDTGVLSLDTKRWAAFPVDPEADSSHEDVVFGRLSGIFDAILQAAAHATGTAAKLNFTQKPATAPTSERTNTSRPDAYLLLVNKKSVGGHAQRSVDCWDDIAVSFEFKKRDGESEGERADNEKKLIWSLHHVMRSDPCRRSTLGVTIENTQMRLWFTCRSVLVVSESFNFVTSTKQVIHLFCSLAFAEDHELGWDSTIQRVLVEGKTQYDISLQSPDGSISVYRTTRIISDFGAEALRGRGTRVFEAYLKIHPEGNATENSKRVVIKDSWRECDRKREDEIRAEIFSDLEKAKGTEAAEADMKYFLTVLQASDVTVDGKKDDTDQLLHYLPLPTDCGWYSISPSPGLSRTRHTSSVGCPPSYNSRRHAPIPRKIHHRTHSRIVFEEVCTPLFELRNLEDVFETLGDGLEGLRILHSINWVHRDVSPGNILRIRNLGKIADLEYAKRMGSDQSHEVRTVSCVFLHRWIF